MRARDVGGLGPTGRALLFYGVEAWAVTSGALTIAPSGFIYGLTGSILSTALVGLAILPMAMWVSSQLFAPVVAREREILSWLRRLIGGEVDKGILLSAVRKHRGILARVDKNLARADRLDYEAEAVDRRIQIVKAAGGPITGLVVKRDSLRAESRKLLNEAEMLVDEFRDRVLQSYREAVIAKYGMEAAALKVAACA